MNTSTLYADPSDDFSLPKRMQVKECETEDEDGDDPLLQRFYDADYAELDMDLMLFGDTGDDE